MAYSDLRYKRDEPYRFQFGEPIEADFYLNDTLNVTNQSASGKLKILDISLHGMKVETDIDVPLFDDIVLSTKVKIGSYQFTLSGKIVWRKKYTSTLFQYGIKLFDSEHQNHLKKALIEYKRDLLNEQ